MRTLLILKKDIPAERIRVFHTRYTKSKGCWVWNTKIRQHKYGVFHVSSGNGRITGMAHRVSYTIHVGEIPEGMVINHKCRNTFCVNPKHLEVVSQRENVLKGFGLAAINHKKSICLRGHKLSGKNVCRTIYRGSVRRQCRKCSSIVHRARNQRKKVL